MFSFGSFRKSFDPLLDLLACKNFEKFLQVGDKDGFGGLVGAVGCFQDKKKVGKHVQKVTVMLDIASVV